MEHRPLVLAVSAVYVNSPPPSPYILEGIRAFTVAIRWLFLFLCNLLFLGVPLYFSPLFLAFFFVALLRFCLACTSLFMGHRSSALRGLQHPAPQRRKASSVLAIGLKPMAIAAIFITAAISASALYPHLSHLNLLPTRFLFSMYPQYGHVMLVFIRWN